MLDRIAHVAHRGQVHHPIELLRLEEIAHGLRVADVGFDEGEALVPGVLFEVRFFAGAAVIRREVVQADHFIAALQQPLSDMTSDESGGAGDENFHSGG